MAGKKVAVYGWYGHKNLGDEAFKTSFQFLWPQWDFEFFDSIPAAINSYDALIIGAGSFLDQEIKSPVDIKIPIAFIGVGTDTSTHPKNKIILDRAKIVVSRNQNSRYLYAPDMVLAQPSPTPLPKKKQVVVLPNHHFVPGSDYKLWKLESWRWYCAEMSQVLDALQESGNTITFAHLCTNSIEDDRRASSYIIDLMRDTSRVDCIYEGLSLESCLELCTQSSLVVTQRFHGMIFSIMSKTPYVAISGHSKMLQFNKEFGYGGEATYYGFTKNIFFNALTLAKTDGFEAYHKRALQTWKDISVSVENALFP